MSTASEAQGLTILVVEDDAGVRNLLRDILEMSGYRVLQASSGAEALTLVAACPHVISLLITDVQMPKMSGREVARRFGLMRPDPRVLFVSGYTEDEVLREGVEEHTYAFLHKPFTVPELLHQVRSALDSRLV